MLNHKELHYKNFMYNIIFYILTSVLYSVM